MRLEGGETHIDSETAKFDGEPENGSVGGDSTLMGTLLRDTETPMDQRNGAPGISVSTDAALSVNGDRTLAERAYAAIHEAIVNGEFAPGHRLRIEELSANLAISPTPIREALNRLEAVGLAEHLPHRGSRVTDVSPGDLRELYEARLGLEPFAVARAAERFTPEAESAARDCLRRFDEAMDRNELQEARRAHTCFHFTLYGASKSRWLIRLITPLWESSQRYRARWKTLTDNPHRCDREHESVLEACVLHDANRAATELYNHLARHANQVSIEMVGKIFFDLKDLQANPHNFSA